AQVGIDPDHAAQAPLDRVREPANRRHDLVDPIEDQACALSEDRAKCAWTQSRACATASKHGWRDVEIGTDNPEALSGKYIRLDEPIDCGPGKQGRRPLGITRFHVQSFLTEEGSEERFIGRWREERGEIPNHAPPHRIRLLSSIATSH